MIKSRRNYSYSKAAELLASIISESLTDMARYQNESIQRGIDTQTDINNKKFTALSQNSTLPIRRRRGHGFTPLSTMKTGTVGSSGRDFSNSKSMRATRMIPSKPNTMLSQVLMLNKHGVYHNEGFTSGGMIKGKTVPKREWFGITKDMKKGGTQYEKYVRITLTKIAKSLKK